MEFEILKVLFDDSRRRSKVVLEESPSDDERSSVSSICSDSSQSLSRPLAAERRRNRKPPYGTEQENPRAYRSGPSGRNRDRERDHDRTRRPKRKRGNHGNPHVRRDPTYQHRPVNYWSNRGPEENYRSSKKKSKSSKIKKESTTTTYEIDNSTPNKGSNFPHKYVENCAGGHISRKHRPRRQTFDETYLYDINPLNQQTKAHDILYDTTSTGESYGHARVRHPNEAQTLAAPVTWRRFSAHNGGNERKYRREKQRRRTFDETHIISSASADPNGAHDIFGEPAISRIPFHPPRGEINPFTGEPKRRGPFRNPEPIPVKAYSQYSKKKLETISDQTTPSPLELKPPSCTQDISPQIDTEETVDSSELYTHVKSVLLRATTELDKIAGNLEESKPQPKLTPRPSPAQKKRMGVVTMKAIPSVNLSPKAVSKDQSSSFSSIRKTLGRLNQDTSESTNVGDASWGSIRKSLAKLQQRYIDNTDSSAGPLHLPDSSPSGLTHHHVTDSSSKEQARTDSIPTIPPGPSLPVVHEYPPERQYAPQRAKYDNQARSSQELNATNREENHASIIRLQRKQPQPTPSEFSEVRNVLQRIDESYLGNNLELVPYIHKHRSETSTNVSKETEYSYQITDADFGPTPDSTPFDCSRLYYFINFYILSELACITCFIVYFVMSNLLPLLIFAIVLQLYLIVRIIIFFPRSISLQQNSVYFHSMLNILHWAIPRQNIISIRKTKASPLDCSCRPPPTIWFQLWISMQLNFCSCSARGNAYIQTRRHCHKLDFLLNDPTSHRNNFEAVLNHLNTCDICFLRPETEI